jgi:membrane protein DedA with SNARE-associated domain
VWNLIQNATDQLGDWAANWWFIAVIFTVAYLDSIIPAVPSETSVIIGAVAVSVGEAPYPLIAVIVAGATGAFLGDNTAYLIGRRFAPWFERRAAKREKSAKRLEWARHQLVTRGGPLLITARFIPGGRSIITISSGITRQSHPWFAKWVAIAAVIWATYAAGLAFIVGQPFEDNHTAAFWVAFLTALAVNVLVEVVRHIRSRRAEERGVEAVQ